MYESPLDAIAAALTASLGVPVKPVSDLPTDIRDDIREALFHVRERVASVEIGSQRFICAAFDGVPDEVLLAGPLDAADEDARAEETIRESLEAAAAGLRLVVDEPRLRLELSRQMELLSSAIVAISSELEIEAVLQRITDLARNFAAAKYAALGIPDARGQLQTFITAGLSEEDEARISHRPEGLGLLGLLLRHPNPIRLDDLSTHSHSVGFPEHHPVMESFLGVPIISRAGNIIGSLYLAEKRFEARFTVGDEMLIELLARHAAVAIENARLYQRLSAEEQRLTMILDQLPEAVMIAESDPPRIVTLNQQARRLIDMYGPLPIPVQEFDRVLQMEDASGRSVSMTQTPIIRSLEFGETVVREELTVDVPSGRRRTFLVNSAPMEPDGGFAASICVFQDITEIRDADRIKDDFLSLVSHELRTPLTTIHGGVQLLSQQAEALDQQTRDEILADINQESARLSTLIQNMVQLTHIRAGRIALEPEPVLLRIAVERCVRNLRPLDRTRAFNVEIADNAVAMADPDRLDEMLRNVIQNALKYTPAGTPIDITGKPEGDQVKISVRDYGPGIPEHEVASVFHRFERGARAAADSSGMGLGLYLVRLLVEAQNGDVWIELPEDGGVCVLFSLPRASDL